MVAQRVAVHGYLLAGQEIFCERNNCWMPVLKECCNFPAGGTCGTGKLRLDLGNQVGLWRISRTPQLAEGRPAAAQLAEHCENAADEAGSGTARNLQQAPGKGGQALGVFVVLG
jgi:hypothetical protein